jgi:predicted acyl esterase
VIEWAASQPWCDGGVGLSGVSYLAMSQWSVAALRPPHLKAIVPWEGVSDLYREMAFHGGIPETGFVPIWWKKRMMSGRNKQFDFAEDFLVEIDRHPLEDWYWRGKQTALERINVPALVCASWSDHGLHTRGSFEAFERIGSPEKWLYTHGRKKWETYYEAEAVATQKRFLDHYLKGQDNGWCATPRVRIEVRKAYYRQDVRREAHWPLPDTRFVPLYLDADQGALRVTPVATEAHIAYDATRGQAAFSLRFTEAVELTGAAKLHVWVSTSDGNDLDLFVVLKKFDERGREVFFSGKRLPKGRRRQRLVARLAPRPRSVTEPTVAAISLARSAREGISRRDRTGRDRDPVIQHLVRAGFAAPDYDSWPRRGEISGLQASSSHQPRQACDPLRRALRFSPPRAVDSRSDPPFGGILLTAEDRMRRKRMRCARG